MLEIYKELAEKHGLTPLKKFKVKGRTGIYTVKLLSNGLLECNCIAGSMGKECRHKKLIRKRLK